MHRAWVQQQSTRLVLTRVQCFSTVTRPDPVSNIRTVRYTMDPSTSQMRSQLEARRLRATMTWNEFWTAHNSDYNARLAELKETYKGQPEIPSSVMSNFYAQHLQATRHKHKEFNSWWIKENFGLLFAHARCWVLEKIAARQEPGFFGGH